MQNTNAVAQNMNHARHKTGLVSLMGGYNVLHPDSFFEKDRNTPQG
jgi:hypothetical protein